MTKTEISNTATIKKAIGKAAADLIQEDMVVGLGTGSTAKEFVIALGLRVRQGLNIVGVPTSRETRELAESLSIPLLNSHDFTHIDLTIDGADEVDPHKKMIKGGGGALLYEKIVASSSQEMVVIIDQSKLVKQFGKLPLPVEIVPFGYKSTLQKIEGLGFTGKLRLKVTSNNPFTTDAGHYILDILIPNPAGNLEQMHLKLLEIPGVVETGFFFHLAGRLIVGYADGRIEIRA